MEVNLDSNRKTARLAGFLFVFLCIPLATWGLIYVHSKIFVPKDPAVTAHNLLSNEFLFRTGIVSHLASATTFALMALILYRIFRPVDRNLSRLMVAPALVQVPVVIVLEIFNIAALMILKGDALITVDVSQKQEFSFFLLRMHRYGIGITQSFWGLFFLPFGMLIFRSELIPRIFGILVIISGIGYIADGCTYILLQQPDYLMVRQFVMVAMFMGMPIMLWLLIKGVRDQRAPVH